MESEDTFAITLNGSGISLERIITHDQMVQILAVVLGAVPRGAMAPNLAPNGGGGSQTELDPEVSPREFILEHRPRTLSQKILTLATYHVRTRGQQTFSRDEIRALFEPAGETIGQNFIRDFNNAAQEGWITESTQNPGAFRITNTGSRAFEAGFPPSTSDPRGTTQRARSKKRRSARTPTIKTADTKTTTNAKAAPTTPRRKPSSGTGGQALIRVLLEEGFFKTGKTIGAVKEHLEINKGRRIPINNLSSPLLTLVREKLLTRIKNGDGQFEYTAV